MAAFMKRGLMLLVVTVLLTGCGEDLVKPEVIVYAPATSPENVLENLQVAYGKREADPYAALLADDFRFYFDEGTRQQNSSLPVFWNRVEDSVQTQGLFESDEVTDIRVQLQPGSGQPVNEPGKETWVLLSVLDTFLEVDLEPRPGELEGLTLRVDGQRNDFFFRKGKTAADTLASSDTAKLWYLVEWRDHGQGRFAVPEVLIENTTWGGIKTLYRKGEPLTEPITWSRVKALLRAGQSPAVLPGTGRVIQSELREDS